MKGVALAVAALALGVAATFSSPLVPGATDDAYAQAARQDRAAARAATRQKRADCRRQASAQKLRFLKRQRFIRSCMRGTA